MKAFYTLMLLAICTINSYSQWTNTYTSSSLPYTTVSSFIAFDKVGNSWKDRIYSIDSLKFQVMGEDFSSTPQYTYTFSAAERLAGELVYSTGYDLNGDNKADFYVMSYYGTSTAYRSAFKVIDVTTGNAIFQKDDPNFSYTYPIFEDINNDGKLECIIMKYPYPSLLTYTTEVYTTGITAVAGDSRPAEFKLSQNYPNPFNPSTKIDFSLNQPSSVSVKIYDIKGALVKTLLNSYKNSGSYDVTWDGTNDSGKRLSTGVYFYELISDNNQIVKKMLLLK